MKTLIFILLKIGELIITTILYVLFCKLAVYTEVEIICEPQSFTTYSPLYFIVGVCIALIVFIIFYGLYLLFPNWITKNKEWSEKIYNKLKK